MTKRASESNERPVEPNQNSNTIKTKIKKRQLESLEDGPLKIHKSSEARKVSKRLKRVHNGEFNNDNEKQSMEEKLEIGHTEEIGVREDSKTLEKAARKAEKARLKALKRLGKTQSDGPSQSIEDLNDRSEALPTAFEDGLIIDSTYTEDPRLTVLPQSEIDTFLSTNFITITDPTSSTLLRPILDFAYLPKSSASAASPFTNFKSPTPIQAAAWPFLLSNRDVVGVAETGSGKTLAFGVPCIRSIVIAASKKPSKKHSKDNITKAVIVSPTRELAVQTYEQIYQLAHPAGLQTACIYGGVPKDPQRLAVPKAHIIVATPGRLNDLVSEGYANLAAVNYMVLDEADRMLEKGFEDDIRKIINGALPISSGRQTLMFTATWPPSVRALASTFMRLPVHIAIGRDNPTGALRANAAITQRVEVVLPANKESRLLQLIKTHQSGVSKNDRILVFCLYKKEAARVEGFLRSRGFRVVGIHGDMKQAARSASLESFKSGECPLLVATDVAARGLDIPAVKLVLNVTFPLTVEDYVHRIGRFVSSSSPPSPSLSFPNFPDYLENPPLH